MVSPFIGLLGAHEQVEAPAEGAVGDGGSRGAAVLDDAGQETGGDFARECGRASSLPLAFEEVDQERRKFAAVNLLIARCAASVELRPDCLDGGSAESVKLDFAGHLNGDAA